MTFMDRTQEFNNVAESVRSRQNTTKMVKRTPLQHKSQFSLAAARIGKEISDTSDKIAKLTILAKKRDIFNDPRVEIEELTFIIKQNIQNLNKEIANLKDFSRSSSGGNSTSNNKQNLAHSDTVVTYLNSKLATTTKDFKDILQIRTENIKAQSEARGLFVNAPSTPTRVPSASPLYKYDSLPESPVRTGGEVAIAMPSSLMLVQQDEYTSSRATAVENIERTIAELGGIFQQLASLVAEQGDMIQRIDENIDNTTVHVERAQSELLKVLYNVSSSRMLIVKLFLILIVFAVIFIVFFV